MFVTLIKDRPISSCVTEMLCMQGANQEPYNKHNARCSSQYPFLFLMSLNCRILIKFFNFEGMFYSFMRCIIKKLSNLLLTEQRPFLAQKFSKTR